MDFMDSLDRLPLFLGRSEPILDVNPADHKDITVELNLSRGVRSELIVACVDMARLQRAPECSRESAGGRRHDVI